MSAAARHDGRAGRDLRVRELLPTLVAHTRRLRVLVPRTGREVEVRVCVAPAGSRGAAAFRRERAELLRLDGPAFLPVLDAEPLSAGEAYVVPWRSAPTLASREHLVRASSRTRTALVVRLAEAYLAALRQGVSPGRVPPHLVGICLPIAWPYFLHHGGVGTLRMDEDLRAWAGLARVVLEAGSAHPALGPLVTRLERAGVCEAPESFEELLSTLDTLGVVSP